LEIAFVNRTDIYRQAIKRTFADLYGVSPDTVDVSWTTGIAEDWMKELFACALRNDGLAVIRSGAVGCFGPSYGYVRHANGVEKYFNIQFFVFIPRTKNDLPDRRDFAAGRVVQNHIRDEYSVAHPKMCLEGVAHSLAERATGA
jgi:hypothetical protein